ncbi:MAG: gamma-glutamyltransferase family protein, partial [Caulobacteraceae bacterium]
MRLSKPLSSATAAIALAALPTLVGAQTTAPQSSTARHEMVAAANPLAVEAGLRVLHAGGSAADAVVAVQAVLGLVEPQSSGLGGGAFLLYYDAKTKTVTAYNGREKAPSGATPDMFEGPNGKPMPFVQGVLSGRSTGTPGAIAMFALLQKQHGRVAWSSLFGSAIDLADHGFHVTPRLAADINSKVFPQAVTPDATAYFTKPDGTRYQVGDLLNNPAYAATLRTLAAEGIAGLTEGRIARDIAAKVHEGPIPGALTAADIAAYRPVAGQALCRPYHAYIVCAPPPPGGGVGVLELIGELESTDIASRGPSDPESWFDFAQASRLMYADRDHYEGDPDFVKAPIAGLIDPAYDADRAKLIPTEGAAAPQPGTPPGATTAGPDHTPEPGGTSDIAIVDKDGNVVSVTTTVESIFGSGRMVDGFFLNNQLTDFSFSPTEPSGAPAANAVAPNKRPRSSMSPVIVLDRQGRFVAAMGSPGGPSIIAYVAKALIGVFDWKLPIQQAFALPNIVAKGDVVAVEKGADPKIVAVMRAHGLNV